jgi:integrase
VRALDPWFSDMKARVVAEGWRGVEDAPIIEGSPSYCTGDLFRAIGSWMRKLGWKTNKTNHALRAYAGSQVAMKYRIYDAQAWLRHSTVKVTEDHYSQYVKDFKPANLDEIPARWATLERPEPQFRVLPQLA